jgi:hypothetical protein
LVFPFYAPEEGDWRLSQLLRVPDIAEHHPVERQAAGLRRQAGL